ncbi:hypothetical protein P7K49_022373, partial [Saguinus oedipus]
MAGAEYGWRDKEGWAGEIWAWQPLQSQLLYPSEWPLQAQLIPHSGLSGPVLGSLLSAPPGPARASRGLSKLRCCLLASSLGPALPPSCVYRPTSCLALKQPLWTKSAPAQLLAASVDPKSPQVKLSRPTQLMPHGGLSRLSSCPPMASPGPKLPQVSFSQPCSSLLSMAPAGLNGPEIGCSSPAPALPAASLGTTLSDMGHSRASSCLLSGLSRLSLCLPHGSFPRPSSSSLLGLQVQLLPHNNH